MTTGKELRKQGVEILRAAGWVVRFMDHHKRMPQGAVGLPDIMAWRQNVCLLIELKGENDTLRKSQKKFRDAIKPNIGTNLVWARVDDVGQFDYLVNVGRE